MPKLLFLVTEDWYFYSHRLPMARAALAAGFDVGVVTNVADHKERIEAEGLRVIPFSLSRGSMDPLEAVDQIRRLAALYRAETPDLVHHVAMKPVLYGSLAARMAKVPAVVNAFAGLGYVFTGNGVKNRLLRATLIPAFRVVLKRPGTFVLLQNHDDRALLERHHVVQPGQVTVIPGSGVDTEIFARQAFPTTAAAPGTELICAFAGRMIEIKGLATLQEAFALLAKRAPHIKLWLCGKPDEANPGRWTTARLKRWEQEAANVTYKGYCDMQAVWAQAAVALQPSWGGEGVPKSLLVAGSCGRAIVATDVPGCRDVVEEGRNGFLVPPRDPAALADAIEKMAADRERCAEMGAQSRKLIGERGFSAAAVGAQTAALYRRCLEASRAAG